MKSTAELLHDQTLRQKICRECGQPFELPAFVSSITAGIVHVCPTCSERHALEDQHRVILNSKSLREQQWKAICPLEFRETQPHRLPSPTKLQIVLRWTYGRRGLLLHGPTGSGKSRCAWVLLKREFDAGRTLASLDASAGLNYAALFADSTAEARDWKERLSTADILFMDDVFKCKLTDSFEGTLFSIIGRRTEHGLPIIATTNDDGDSLTSRLTADRGAPLIRRLREHCEPIAFTTTP